MIKIEKSMENTIKQVCKQASTRATIQALANVLIKAEDGKLNMTAGDGKVEITASIDANIKSGGKISVDAQKFIQALTVCNFDCTILLKDEFIEIKSGKRKIKLTTLNPDAYPDYQNIGDEVEINIDVDDIKSVSISSATNDTRSYLNGVYLGKDIAATNGHRITFTSLNSDADVIVPIESVKSIPQDTDRVTTDGRTICFHAGNVVLKSKLIDGKYPNYARAIIAPSEVFSCDAQEFSDAVKAASIASENITVTLNDNSGKVTSRSKDNHEVDIDFEVKFSGSKEIAFNGQYVVDALKFYTGNTDIGLTENMMIIDGNFKNVVMAVRI